MLPPSTILELYERFMPDFKLFGYSLEDYLPAEEVLYIESPDFEAEEEAKISIQDVPEYDEILTVVLAHPTHVRK